MGLYVLQKKEILRRDNAFQVVQSSIAAALRERHENENAAMIQGFFGAASLPSISSSLSSMNCDGGPRSFARR